MKKNDGGGFIVGVYSGKRNNMKHYLLGFFMSMLTVGGVFAGPLSVESPDGRTSVFFEVKDGALFYSVKQSQSLIVDASELRIFPNSKTSVVESAVTKKDTYWLPTYGQFSKIRDHYHQLTMNLNVNSMPVQLECRAYDTGVAFRFVLSDESKGQKVAFSSAYNLLDAASHYYPGGERGVTGPVKLDNQKRIQVPLVTERADGGFVAFLESDLYSAPAFNSMNISLDPETKTVKALSSTVSRGDGQTTPWRVIIFGPSAGDLLVNTVALNVAAPCKLKDASWVKPGKSLWDWRIHDYHNGQFAYGINTQSYMRLINFAAEQDIEYLLIDDHWFTNANAGTMTVAEAVDMEKVMSHAKDKGVGILLYYDRKKGDYGDDLLFSHYARLGASGMKYGFMGNKADFTREAINAAAENKLLLNFHDGPCPMTGVQRTMPNLVTREYCHAQQDGRRAFTPESFLKMAMVNALIGPLDQANGNFGIKSINAGQRAKGPRIKNSYISTVTSEVARTLVVFSGVITLPDAPEEYMKKADLFEFLKNMPATWDDTHVLNSKIGEYITVARRAGDTWYVGSVNDQNARALDVTLDFLEPGCSYEATLYQDASDAHGVNNPEAYEIKTITAKRGDVIRAKMVSGGGHAMVLHPTKRTATAEESTSPNVIFLLTDDLGYSDLSCYGATRVKTPNIDRMATEGLRFTDFHTAASICSPSRAAFLTGAYPQRCGLYMGINRNREAHWFLGLNPDEITIAEQFKMQGYTTAMVGKWHLGSEEKFSHFHQGFDHYYGAPSNMGHDRRFFDGREVIYEQSPLDQLTTLYTERMVKYIEAFKDQPFFIYFAHNYPHTPYKAGARFKGSSRDGVRGDVIQELDWGVGEILKALGANGILDKTMVIFSSDNGPLKEAYARPYSGTKYVSLEGGHRVPFIVYWKGGIQKPAVVDVPANAMDLFPTLSELIGAPMPTDRIYDGVSLTPMFSGKAIARSVEEPFFYYNCENLQAVRVGDWKLHLPRTKQQIPWWARKKQKPIDTPQLYNLATDVGEKKDVAAEHPERVFAMMALADETRLKLGEFGVRGSQQRPTGTLFPEVPILSNQTQDWDALSDAEKGRAKKEFKGTHRE